MNAVQLFIYLWIVEYCLCFITCSNHYADNVLLIYIKYFETF